MNKKIAGLIIITVALVSIFIWEFWGRENLAYKEVLVMKDDTPASTVIKAEDFTTKKVENPSTVALKAKDINWLTGMETAQYVPGGIELRKEFFISSQYNTTAEKGKHILCVPEDWVLSFPKGIRRGDRVSFYKGKLKIVEAVVIHAYDSAGQEVSSKDNDRLKAEGVVSRIEIVSSAEKLIALSEAVSKGKKVTMFYD